jgi:transcriptional regulator with XRE-family HTH domain
MQARVWTGAESPEVPKRRPIQPPPSVTARLAALVEEQGVTLKELASLLPRPDGKGTKTPANVGSALRGESNLLLTDAERIAPKLGASIEVVVHNNPMDEFRRALYANTDLDPEFLDDIWAAFERRKTQAALRTRPKKGWAGSSTSSRVRPA